MVDEGGPDEPADYEGVDYREFWVGPEKARIDRTEQRIIAEALKGGGTIADIGAGFGRLAPSYMDRYDRVYMVEPASNLRALVAATYGGDVECVDGSVYDLPFKDGSCDAVLMIRVLHHLTDVDAALAELCRVLCRGGSLLFSYSNKRNVARMVKFLTGRSSNPFSRGVETYGHALFGHHPTYIEERVAGLGLRIRRQYALGLTSKLAAVMPPLSKLVAPSSTSSRIAGVVKLSPTQLIL